MSVTSEATPSGYAYRIVVHLRETGGAAATISSVDFTFMNGSSQVVNSHFVRPISDTANECPASGTIASRELVTPDNDRSHPYATTVQAKVTFTDPSRTGTATASADVPAPAAPPPPAPAPTPPPAPQPTTFTLAGVVRDENTGQAIAGGLVRILDGPNAAKASSTDGNGYYSIAGLVVSSFTVQATADGYDLTEWGLTVSSDTRLDLKMRRAAPCLYTVGPSANVQVPQAGGGFTATVTRTSGSCPWFASTNVNWITLGKASASEGGGLGYAVAANTGASARTGNLTIQWSNGSAQITVTQAGGAPDPSPAPEQCRYAISPVGPVAVAQPGGAFTLAITRTSGACAWQASASASWITLTNPAGGGSGTLAYFVASNNAFVGRVSAITVSWTGGNAQVTINQANDWPVFCVATITVGGQNPITVPAGGGQFTASITPVLGMPPGICGVWTASASAPITFVGATTGPTPGAVTFVVPPNGSTTARQMTVSISLTAPSIPFAPLTVTQSGTP